MRGLALVAALSLASVAGAQPEDPPVPDPTAPHLYYPLAVGNVWEYANLGLLPLSFGDYMRREIVGDTLVDGQRYFVEVRSRIPLGGVGWQVDYRRVLRFDTTTATVRALGGFQIECPFDSAFETSINCWSDPEDGYPDGDTFVYGSLDAQIPLGREGEERLDVQAIKSFQGLADLLAVPYYAPPIGYAGAASGSCACRQNLLYARVYLDDGVYEVGARLNVASDDGPEAGALALAVGPNPTDGPLALVLDVPAPATLTLEVFDALGRRVWAHEVTLAAGRQRVEVDAGRWAPGLYVVRAAGPMGTATATVVRR